VQQHIVCERVLLRVQVPAESERACVLAAPAARGGGQGAPTIIVKRLDEANGFESHALAQASDRRVPFALEQGRGDESAVL
jgi:hypothetical protein